MLSSVHDLTSTVGIVALAAGGVAVVSLGLSLALVAQLRRLRSDQRLVMGDTRRDLPAHAAALVRKFDALHA